MKLLRRQIALAVTGLFLTGYTVMAADTPAAVAPAAIQHKNEIVQTETVPSLTKREKTTPAKNSRPMPRFLFRKRRPVQPFLLPDLSAKIRDTP